MTQDLGNITLIPGIINTFSAPFSGVAGIIIGNESGFTCDIQMGVSSNRSLKPGTQDFFPINNGFNGVIIINPKSLLTTANLYPSQTIFFEAVGFHEGFDPSGYPMALPRNTTGSFAGTQQGYQFFFYTIASTVGKTKFILPSIPANFQTNPLTLYGSDAFSPNPQIPPLSGEMAQTTGGTETTQTMTPATSTSGWLEVASFTQASSPINANIPNPTGLGWSPGFLPPGATGIPAGNWSASIGLTYGLSATTSLTLRISTYNADTQKYTIIGTIPITGQAISTTRANFAFPATAMPAVPLPNDTYLYFDLFAKLTTNWATADNVTVFESNSGGKGLVNDVQINTPGINVPITGALNNGNILYTKQQSVYFGGIDIDVVQATAKTQIITNVTNIDPTTFTQVKGALLTWRYSVAIGANINAREHYFSNPFKSATGQQIEIDVFNDTGTETITGQIYYYVQ
jgi:hypothetical protein